MKLKRIAKIFLLGASRIKFVRKMRIGEGYLNILSMQFGKIASNPCVLKDGSQKVVFASIVGLADTALAFEGVLAHRLKRHGVSSRFLGCGSFLNNCMWDTEEYIRGNRSGVAYLKRRLKCFECSSNIKALASSLSCEYNSLAGERYTPVDSFEPPDLSEHYKSSAVRKCLVSEFDQDLNSKLVSDVFKEEALRYYNTLYAYFSREKPLCVVMVHGIYLEHGVVVTVCKDLDIPIYVYGFGYRNKTVMVTKGESYHKAVYSIPSEQWDNDLTEEQNKALDDYLFSKVSGGRDWVNYHPDPDTNVESLCKKYKIDSSKDTILFCTNVVWDASIYYSSDIYSTMMEGLVDTIDIAMENNLQLIIRIHPAESKGGFSTKTPLYEELKKKYLTFPDNIIVIPSDSDASTYSLGEIANVIIIYASNVGLEFSATGKTVINIGNAYASRKGFSFEPENLSDYHEWLIFPDKRPSMTSETLQKARNFAYFWFFRLMTHISQINFDITQTRESTIDVVSLDSDCDDNLDHLVQQMVSLKELDYRKFKDE